ncbi:MAG: RrF2 family transcriptional regulator [Planctomycetota bacterium]
MPHLLRIPEAASLGLHAAVTLAARPQGRVSTRELAEGFGASEAHLAKVMQRLKRAGLVTATRGPKGGFQLARPADSITLLDIYEAVEGPVEPLGCLLGRPSCVRARCLFGDFIQEFDTRFRGYMATTTLAQLIEHEETIDAATADHQD